MSAVRSLVRKAPRFFVTALGDHVATIKAYDPDTGCVHEVITVSHPKPIAVVAGLREPPQPRRTRS